MKLESKKVKKTKTVDAAIVVADIEDSSEFANWASIEEYNQMVREYHQRSYEAVCHYQGLSGLLDCNFEGVGRGDEVILFVHGLPKSEIAIHAFKLALHLQETWLNSNFNRKRYTEGKGLAYVRVGIGEGVVIFENNAWADKETPEGFSISQAKRIEGRAGSTVGAKTGSATAVKIMIKATLRAHIENGVSGIVLGSNCLLENLKGVGDVEAFPVLSYGGFLEELRATPDRGRNDSFFPFLKAHAGEMAGDYVEAEKAYREAIMLKPSAEAYANLGFSLSKQEKHTEAVKELQTAINLDKENPKSYFYLGYAYGEQEKWTAAEEAYREAIRLKENYIEAHHNLGVVLGEQGRHLEAEEELCRARFLNPNDSLALYNLGLEYLIMNDFDMADTSLREMIRLHPTTALGRYYLWHKLRKKGKRYEADQLYQEMQNSPDCAKGFVSLAVSLDKHGQRKEARGCWELALRKEKRPEWVARIKKRLAEPD